MSVIFPVTSLLSLPVQVYAQSARLPAFAAPRPVPLPAVHADPAWHTIDYHAPDHAAAAIPLPANNARPPVHAERLTLLDEVGRLASPVAPDKVVGWKRLLHQPKKLAALDAAKLHVLVGEVTLAQDENPEQALWHFAQAQELSSPNNAAHGLAAYDSAVATFYQGAYGAAQAAFAHVLTARPGLHGFDRATCTLFMRHARACAGYHAERAALGIPEPPRLDPLCGASSLAYALKTYHKPYDKPTLLRNMRVTGRGSNMQDVLNGAHKLGLAAHVVHVKDAGLILLPKPLVAYVEHDHFVSVTNADKNGVTYLCADCGPWPGGRVSLTWAQWHRMEATAYAVLTPPGSDIDGALSAMATPNGNGAQGVQTASVGGKLAGGVTGRVKWMRLLRKQISQPSGGESVYCGYGPGSQHCPDPVNCPDDCGGNSGGGEGPSMGDPVNLATGEEEYKPGVDLRVYNPVGPSVSWGRIYNSLRSNDTAIEMDDFGQGWSHVYNITVYDPTVTRQAGNYAPGDTLRLTATGTDAPAAPAHWDVLLGGSVIATDANPQGWQVSSAGGSGSSITVSVPANASLGNYEARSSGGLQQQSRLLPRRSAATCRRGQRAGGNNPASAFFTLSAPVYVANTGTRFLVEPNGARISVTANAVPTAAQPRVPCTVQAGVAMLVEWDYDANNALGHYVITSADRTQVVTTPPLGFRTQADNVYLPASTIAAVYGVGQQIDRNGNAIAFNYGAADSRGFRLLSSIADKNGAVLLTLNRASDGTGNLTSVADRYGRSVYYRVSAYATQNVPAPFPQSQQELDHVSQVVATGAASPPDRYVYGYQNIRNNEGSENIPFLSTITVPSPTGTGTATATINYTPFYCTVSSLVDANGNTRSYSQPDASHTQITVTDPQGGVVYRCTVGYDMNMSQTTKTNGLVDANGRNTQIIAANTYADPNNPYFPSQTQDGNGYAANGANGKGTWEYTWDQFGNCGSVTTPRGTITTNTFSYQNFALGELTQMQTGAKQATTYTYYEPSCVRSRRQWQCDQLQHRGSRRATGPPYRRT